MSENLSFLHLIPLHPWIKIFFKVPAVLLSLLYWPPTSCKVSEKTIEWSLRCLQTDKWTDLQTSRLQVKGDYYGSYQVNPRSKIIVTLCILSSSPRIGTPFQPMVSNKFFKSYSFPPFSIWYKTLLLIRTPIRTFCVVTPPSSRNSGGNVRTVTVKYLFVPKKSILSKVTGNYTV